MSKATPANLTAMGFVAETFGVAAGNPFNTYLQDILDSVAVEVAAEVGATAYADTTEPTNTRVINAERYHAASILQERILAYISRSNQGSEGKKTGWSELEMLRAYQEKSLANIMLVKGGQDESFDSSVYEPEAVQ